MCRLRFYLQNLGIDTAAILNQDTDFQGLADIIQKPIDDGGLKLTSYEKQEMDKYDSAHKMRIAVGSLETLESIFRALPTVAEHATPLGVGVAYQWGPPNLCHAAQAVARGLRIGADVLTFEASSAGRKALSRALQDRTFQANLTRHEIKSTNKQILAGKTRLDMANRELASHQKQID